MAAPTLPQSGLLQRILTISARAEHAFCREPQENQEQQRARWWVRFKQELKELLEAMGQVQSPMRIPPFAFAVWQERNRASENPQGDTSIRPHNLVMYGNRQGTEGLFTADTDYRVPHVEGWWQSFPLESRINWLPEETRQQVQGPLARRAQTISAPIPDTRPSGSSGAQPESSSAPPAPPVQPPPAPPTQPNTPTRPTRPADPSSPTTPRRRGKKDQPEPAPPSDSRPPDSKVKRVNLKLGQAPPPPPADDAMDVDPPLPPTPERGRRARRSMDDSGGRQPRTPTRDASGARRRSSSRQSQLPADEEGDGFAGNLKIIREPPFDPLISNPIDISTDAVADVWAQSLVRCTSCQDRKYPDCRVNMTYGAACNFCRVKKLGCSFVRRGPNQNQYVQRWWLLRDWFLNGDYTRHPSELPSVSPTELDIPKWLFDKIKQARAAKAPFVKTVVFNPTATEDTPPVYFLVTGSTPPPPPAAPAAPPVPVVPAAPAPPPVPAAPEEADALPDLPPAPEPRSVPHTPRDKGKKAIRTYGKPPTHERPSPPSEEKNRRKRARQEALVVPPDTRDWTEIPSVEDEIARRQEGEASGSTTRSQPPPPPPEQPVTGEEDPNRPSATLTEQIRALSAQVAQSQARADTRHRTAMALLNEMHTLMMNQAVVMESMSNRITLLEQAWAHDDDWSPSVSGGSDDDMEQGNDWAGSPDTQDDE